LVVIYEFLVVSIYQPNEFISWKSTKPQTKFWTMSEN